MANDNPTQAAKLTIDESGLLKSPQESNSLLYDVMDGFAHSVHSHIDGAKQAFGAKIEATPHTAENGANQVGHVLGEASLFVGTAIVFKKLPLASEIAEGKIAAVAGGALMGFTTPLAENQGGAERLSNTALGAGTMAMLEFAPKLMDQIPAIAKLPETGLGRSFLSYGLSSGMAGFANTEGQALLKTGQSASLSDLAIGTATWMALGTAGKQVANSLESMQAAKAAAKAAYLPENAEWQFKNVTNINAADLAAGEKLAPGNYRVTFISEGAQRKANIYLSDGAVAAEQPAPLVTHLHGLNPNGQAEEILSELNYFKLADQDGAVVAMLQGRDGLKGFGTFQSFHDTNFGYAKPAADVAPYSDQIAFGDMVNFIRDHVPNANTDNMAVSGFSLGGKMANRIAATRPDVGVVASIHGTMDKFDEDLLNMSMNKHPVDGIFVLGTRDKVLPIDGGKSIFTLGLENNQLSRPLRQAEFWGESNGNPSALTTDNSAYTRRDWHSVDGSNRISEFTVKDGAHAIDGAPPRSNFIQWLMGAPKPANYFDARQKTWDFMLNSLKKQQAAGAEASTAKAS